MILRDRGLINYDACNSMMLLLFKEENKENFENRTRIKHFIIKVLNNFTSITDFKEILPIQLHKTLDYYFIGMEYLPSLRNDKNTFSFIKEHQQYIYMIKDRLMINLIT